MAQRTEQIVALRAAFCCECRVALSVLHCALWLCVATGQPVERGGSRESVSEEKRDTERYALCIHF